MELVLLVSRRKPAILLCLCMTNLLMAHVQGFSIRTTKLFGHYRQLRPRLFTSLAEQEGAEKKNGVAADIHTQDSANSFSNREYWLDLRGTAIYPRQALHFLHLVVLEDDDEDTCIQDLVDRILITQHVFDQLIDTTAKEMDLYYVTDEQQLVLSRHDTQQSFPAGKVVTCQPNSVLDPLAAMEVNSNGGWLLIDSEDSDPEESSWMEEQVMGLLTFLSATATASASSDSGLFVPTLSPDESTTLRGGIAISCPTKNMLLQMDSVLTRSLCSDMITTSTDSGILLPTGMSNRKSPPLTSALVLPFDALLWKTALDLRTLQEEQDDIL